MLRKSLGSNATQVNGRNTSQRRKSLDVKSLSREDDENNKNSVNKRRYSLRSPASKHINSNTTDAGALTGLIESMADNSTFSIHSEGESVASRSNTPSRITSSRQSSLRMSNGSELIAEEESFEVAESAFGFAKSPGGSRRVTADMDDMQALLANLSDSNCSLELSTLSHVSANSLAQEPERGRGALGAATEVAEAAASGPATPNGRNRSRSPRGSARKSFGQPASAAGTSSVESSGPPEQQPGPLSGLEDSTWDALRALRAPSSSSAPGTPAATSVSCLSADPLLDFSGLLGGTSVDDSAHSTLRSKGKDQRHTRRDTADFTDMQGLLDDSALNESLQSGGSSALGFGKRNHARESVETASLEQLLLNVSGGSSCGGEADGSPSPARELRRETVNPFDYRRMLLEDASALRDTSAVAAEAFTPAEGAAVGRRETIDAGDLSSLLSFSVDAAFPATTQEATEEDKEVRDEKDGAMDLDLDFSEGASCFGPLTGRQSIESVGSIGTVALLQCVADTLHGLDNRSTGMRSSGALPHDTSAAASLASSFSLDLSALDALAQRGAQTPTSAAPPSQCSSAPSLLSFSIAASPRAARRETADVSDVLHFAQTLLDEQEDQEGGGASNGAEAESSAYLSSSRLSAHSQSFARTAASALAGGAEVAENERDDGCSDTGTVNAADLDLLNDSMSMSTNESVATIGTLDLLDRVESAMVQDHLLEQGAGDSDAESEMTTDTLPLDEILRQYTDLDEEEVALQVAQSHSRRNSSANSVSARSKKSPSAASTRSAASSAVATPASSSNSSSSQCASPAKSRVGSSSSGGSQKRRRSGDTPSSILADHSSAEQSFDFDLSNEISASRSRLLPLRGPRARASLSTSVVQAQEALPSGQQRNSLRRASVGPIVSSAASSALVAPAISSVSKFKSKGKVVESPAAPSPLKETVVAPALAGARSPAVSTSFNVPSAALASSALKSCLSSRKKARHDPAIGTGSLAALRFDLDTSLTASAVKRNVVFGSPQACEFNKTSPTTSYTPLHKDTAKSLFSMAPQQRYAEGADDFESADAETQENDEVLDQWERLTNGSDYGSDEEEQVEGMEGIPEGSEESGSSRGGSRRSSTGSAVCGKGGRRLSMLQPLVDLSASDASSASIDGSVDRSAVGACPGALPLDLSSSQLGDDATGTVCLPASLADVLRENAIDPSSPAVAAAVARLNRSSASNASTASEHTEEIELDMQALLRKLREETAPHADEDERSTASSSRSSSRVGGKRGRAGEGRRVSVLQEVQGLSGDLSLSQLDSSSCDASAHLGSLLGHSGSDVSTSALASADCSLVVSEDTDSRNTSARSSRSTRSTRSTRSSASASVNANASAEKPASTGRGKKRLSSGSDVSASRRSSRGSVKRPGLPAELEMSGAVPELDASLGEDATCTLEGSLAALVAGLQSTAAEVQPADAGVALDTSVIRPDLIIHVHPLSSPPSRTRAREAAEISVIERSEGGFAEGEDELECDFSELVSPRHSALGVLAEEEEEENAEVSQDTARRLTRRSGRSSHSHQSESRDTFGEFSLLASNEEEEEQIRTLAGIGAGPSSSLMSRLRTLNAGARNNSLLQAGTPSTRTEQSRMSVGMKRQSLMAGNANLNTSFNASVHFAAPPQPLSGAKSSKKARRGEESPVHHQTASPGAAVVPVVAKMASPTPSMSNVYGGGSPSSIRYSANPMRPTKPLPLSLTLAPAVLEVAQKCAEMDAIEEEAADAEGEGDSFQETELLESEMNDSITDYEASAAAMQARLFSHFSAVQTAKTLLSAFRPEVRDLVKGCMVAAVPAAYVDSMLSQVPLLGLQLAWELSPHDSEAFAAQVLAQYPDCYRHQRMQFAERDADQLWINSCAASVLSQASALQAVPVQHQRDTDASASAADRFYSKALNRAPTPAGSRGRTLPSTSSASQLQARAQLAETELLVDIVNRLSYCRITAFQSSCVKVTAMLSPTVDASLVFSIDRQGQGQGQGDQLVVAGIAVDLEIAQGGSTPKAVTAQNLFVSAYFASVMCADEAQGCLSTATLDSVEQPHHIPPLLHKVNGSIAALRLALRALPCLSADGWKYAVARTAQHFKVVATAPGGRAQVHVTVRALVQAFASAGRDGSVSLDGAEAAVVVPDAAAKASPQEAEQVMRLLEARLSVR